MAIEEKASKRRGTPHKRRYPALPPTVAPGTTFDPPLKKLPRDRRFIKPTPAQAEKRWPSRFRDAIKEFEKDYPGVDPDLDNRLSLQTSAHSAQRDWADDNLPNILFYLTPPASENKLPVGDLIERGQVVKNYLGDPMRDLEILPRHISIDVEPWRVEAWRLLDPRVRYQDIFDRMTTDEIFKKRPSKNTMQQHVHRNVQQALNNFTRTVVRHYPVRVEVEAMEQLSPFNIEYNTILSQRCYQFDHMRLIKVGLFSSGEQTRQWHARLVHVTEENLLKTTVPICSFRPGSDVTIPCEPTQRMTNAVTLLFYLQHAAEEQGLDNWSKLPKEYVPTGWNDRVASNGARSFGSGDDSPEGYAEDVIDLSNRYLEDMKTESGETVPTWSGFGGEVEGTTPMTGFEHDIDAPIMFQNELEGAAPMTGFEHDIDAPVMFQDELEGAMPMAGYYEALAGMGSWAEEMESDVNFDEFINWQ